MTEKIKVLNYGLLLIPFVAFGWLVLNFPLTPDGDIYWHLKAGEMIWQNKKIIQTDVYTYTVLGQAEEIHSWLSQVTFWLTYQAFGELGLRILALVLVSLTLIVCMRFLWLKSKNIFLCVLGGCGFFLIHREIHHIRPWLFGELFFSWVVFYVFSNIKFLSKKELLYLLLVTALWANLHPSVLVMIPLTVLYAACLIFKYYKDFRNHSLALLIMNFLLPVGVFISVTLLNPLGWKIYTFLWDLSQVAKSWGVHEWRPLRSFYWDFNNFIPFKFVFRVPEIIHFFLIPLSLLCFKRNAERIWVIAVTLFLFFMCKYSGRHFIFYIFPWIWFLAIGYPYFCEKFSKHTVEQGCVALMVLLMFQFGLTPFKTQAINMPKGAADFLEKNQIEGNLYNDEDWGGYLSFRLFPKIKVAWTTRRKVHAPMISQALKDKKELGKNDLAHFISYYPQTDFLILPIRYQVVQQLVQDKMWRVLYQDKEVVLAQKASTSEK